MCGIAGYLGRKIEGLSSLLIKGIAVRGPDGAGSFEETPVHFVHTRLAVVDVDGGLQPMEPPGSECVVTYNGEIYNYWKLRSKIEACGFQFRTRCDTELIPLGYRAFGLDFFSKIDGMFAFALYDRLTREVHIVRDRPGIKPLFLSALGPDLVFSSSVATVASHPDVDRSLHNDSVRNFLQFRYVPDGHPFLNGIKALEPGSILTWRDGRTKTQKQLRDTTEKIGKDPQFAKALFSRLDESVRKQLRSDAPVGIFLSGGVDSSVIAALARKHANRPITAFTYSIHGKENEVESARLTAQEHGFSHRVVEGSRSLENLGRAIIDMDPPVGDAIVLPTWELCQEASRDVKVVLTGEGADELFGGYVHIGSLQWLHRFQAYPGLSGLASNLLRLIPVGLLNLFFQYPAYLGQMGRDKLASLFHDVGNSALVYRKICSIIDDSEITRASYLEPPKLEGPSALDRETLINDGVTRWLPNQILHKMDSLSMAHGLEARVPYLGANVRSLVRSAPPAPRSFFVQNKYWLRQVATSLGVREAKKAKQAFHLPVERTHRTSLLLLCDDWLNEDEIRRHGILNLKFIQEARKNLERGEFIASKQIVAMACLHMWLDNQRNQPWLKH